MLKKGQPQKNTNSKTATRLSIILRNVECEFIFDSAIYEINVHDIAQCLRAS